MSKKISILGSTGSIGQNTLKICQHLKGDFEVVALAAKSNLPVLSDQIRTFQPKLVAVYEAAAAARLRNQFPQLTVLEGISGLNEAACHETVDLVVSAMTGTIGLEPTLKAIEAKKDIALANKEALVSGGELLMQKVREHDVNLLPIDSEHSALFQCLQDNEISSVNRLILTASGGPFREWSDKELEQATLEEALKHPNWKMGPKVTVDSSTLMNKGFEVIEAYWLFGLPLNQIEVVIHPQSIIHGLVEFKDGSILAQMGEPDMKVPIQYALTYPKRKVGLMKPFDFIQSRRLEFYFPDCNRFRCLQLAYSALTTGGSLPCYMNAANDTLVQMFIDKRIAWNDIARKLNTLMERHEVHNVPSLEAILEVDQRARFEAASIL